MGNHLGVLRGMIEACSEPTQRIVCWVIGTCLGGVWFGRACPNWTEIEKRIRIVAALGVSEEFLVTSLTLAVDDHLRCGADADAQRCIVEGSATATAIGAPVAAALGVDLLTQEILPASVEHARAALCEWRQAADAAGNRTLAHRLHGCWPDLLAAELERLGGEIGVGEAERIVPGGPGPLQREVRRPARSPTNVDICYVPFSPR